MRDPLTITSPPQAINPESELAWPGEIDIDAQALPSLSLFLLCPFPSDKRLKTDVTPVGAAWMRAALGMSR